MGLGEIFGSRSLEALVQKARQRLAAGDFEDAQRLVARGLERFPNADALRELEPTIRRAQARSGLQALKQRVAEAQDPRAYEQLIHLYLDLGLRGEALRETLAYARAHPERDTPHLLLGEAHLDAFLADRLARDAHAARQALELAASLNHAAVKSRLLLAELYFGAGADGALLRLVTDILAGAGNDALLASIAKDVRAIVPEVPGQRDTVDGCFEQVEVRGAFARDPATWPLGRRRPVTARSEPLEAQHAVEVLVSRETADEVVVIRRSGAILARASKEESPGEALVGITCAVAQSIADQVRELDLGTFRRCAIRGPFGLVAVGDVGGLVTGIRWRQAGEAERQWARAALHLEGALEGVGR
jgi:hypothetical protein